MTAFKRKTYNFTEQKSFAWLELFCAFTAAYSFFLVGTLRGYTSPATYAMEQDETFNKTLTQEEISWFASSPSLAAFFGALVGALPLQFFGRQKTIMILTIPFFIGWLLIGFAVNMVMVLCGRALTGFGSGLAISAAQLYVSECARPKIRGMLGLLPAKMMAWGISLGLLLGSLLCWRLAAVIFGVFPFLLFVTSFFLPESPTWLLLGDRDNEAMENLTAIRGQGRNLLVRQDYNEIKQDIQDNYESLHGHKWKYTFLSRDFWWPIVLSFSLMIFQQLSGFSAIIYYFEYILRDAEKMSKYESKLSVDESSALIAGSHIVGFFISFGMIDTLGRRFLLKMSGMLMALSHVVLGTYFYSCEHGLDDLISHTASWLPVTCLCILVGSYSIGFASIPFIVTSEIFPPAFRSYLCSLSSFVNLLATFLVINYFLIVKDALHPGYIYFFFSIICAISCIVVHLLLPETKGKSLAQINLLFRSNFQASKDTSYPDSSFDSNFRSFKSHDRR